jgi:hypothetical protein
MLRSLDRLTEAAIAEAAPRNKAFKLFDGHGLYLLVSPAGGKLWRLKYRFASKERALALGAYPGITLTEARDSRDKMRAFLAVGGDPSQIRREQQASHFLLSWAGNGALTIHSEGQTLRLAPIRVDALRAFLAASGD